MSLNYKLTEHAQERINERGISLEWLERTLSNPTRVELHETDPELSYALAVIPEYGNRVLRVVYKTTENQFQVITAYFDRSLKGKL
jgi:uncharacterized DUF497 family protein